MATGPLSTPEPDPPAHHPHDEPALLARAEEAEAIAEQLATELVQARAEIAELRARLDGADEGDLGLFPEGSPPAAGPRFAVDGSDAGVLPITLAAIAVVVALVAVLSLLNNGIVSLTTLLSLAAAGGLGWAAWQTRVIRTDVHIEDGVVHVQHGSKSYRFDLASKHTIVTVLGDPDDRGFRIRFERRVLDSVEIGRDMLDDPRAFLEELRSYRPELREGAG